MNAPRALPDDFAALAPRMTVRAMCKRWGASDDTIRRWMRRAGIPLRTRERQEPPCDFVALARDRTSADLADHYGVSRSAIQEWARRSGVKFARPVVVRKGKNLRPVPDGFLNLAPQMTRNALRRHFSSSIKTVDRWLREAGLQAKPDHGLRLVPATDVPAPARTIHDHAADILRAFGPVYRCDERGRADHKGGFWRVGQVVVDGDELLARAERKKGKAA